MKILWKLRLAPAGPKKAIGVCQLGRVRTETGVSCKLRSWLCEKCLCTPIDFNGDRDNVVVLSGNPLSHDRELKWRGENGAGRRQLDLEKKSLIERVGAEQADRVWKKLPRQRNAGRPSLNSSTVSSAGGNRGNDVRDEEIANLKKQNKKLASDLENARTHIFSLQSCRKKFTPEDAGRDYDIPVGSVSDWVQKHVAPVADDDDKRKNFDGIARRKPSDISLLRGYLLRHGDLVHGIMFPDTDVDVVIAIVMRFLQDNIFERGCINEPAGQVISAIEVAMQNCVEPKRDQFAIRTWRAEAFTAVLSTPDYATMRKQRLEELTTVLCNGMKLFCQVVGRNLDTVYSSCMEVVVKPALELNEKFLTSTHHFYLNLRTYINRDHNGNLKMSNDFAKDLDKIKCENVLKNRRIIHVEKLDEQLVKDCIEGSFINILTVAPGLHMRQVGRRDTIEPPAVIRKQHVLVAYDGQKGRDHYLSGWQQHSLMGWVYSRPRTFAQFGVARAC
ncbi:hypothetical protein QBC33DRAFT_608211 [Phialemonium atrogriseum]|uniref:Uncharacterized protein n=1 Tax=Phialemonium atrogriseum TaxID=1093897 RepID=A0AAJ0CAZ8_9PEZI|nr:uncharacterized protein QBC33DRAFT_608211 [Phialemonium atrogriseum]KAK1772787.1 hypothetical protein QBC33DRAFT_608211 [Phialemonium atrogriseum]